VYTTTVIILILPVKIVHYAFSLKLYKILTLGTHAKTFVHKQTIPC